MPARPARPGPYTHTDPQTGIRIAIEPSQSAYFAGEPFTCTITFSNVRAGELTRPRPVGGGNAKALSSPSINEGYDFPLTPSRTTTTTTTTTNYKHHTRSSHSVSSVPLARPPTSPGTPKTAAAASYGAFTLDGAAAPGEEGARLQRKGLVGKMDDTSKEKDQERRRLGRSMSLSVDVPYSPTSPSPLSPGRATGLPASHPHARKQSESLLATPSSQLSPDTPNMPNNTTQNTLSTIYENSNSPTYAYPYSAPSTPSGTRFTKPVSLVPQPSFPTPGSSSSPLHPHSVQPHSAYATTFSPLSTELILYAYAQLSGSFNIDLVAVHNAPEMYILRDKLKKGRVGGGSLDFVVGSSAAGGRGHRRGNSWFGLGGLFGSGGTDVIGRGPPAGGSASSPNSGGGVGNEDDLPTFETQPSVLAIDLRLAPGESKSYSYTIDLPANLPPTFKGRAMRFSYQFIVGTCRASSGLAPGSGGNVQTSRVMRVPIRVYNHVSVDSPSRSYDLLWPISKWREKAMAGTVQEVRGTGKTPLSDGLPRRPSPQPVQADPSINENLQSLKLYAQRLLANDPTLENENENENEKERIHSFSPGANGTDVGLGIVSTGGTGGLTGCREAVEIVTRNTRKASYDITKENSKVAELTFVKSAYRLGESVHVVVEFNNDACTSKVLKVSSTLESHERPPWHSSNALETIRRIHAEYYSSGTINTKRVAFGLDIPSDASPGFQVGVGDKDGDPNTKGALEWKIRLCLLIAVSSSGKGNVNGSSSTSLSSMSKASSSKGKNKRIEIRNIRRDDSSDNEADDDAATEANAWGKTWKTVSPMERVTPSTNLQNQPGSPITPKTETPTGIGFTSTASKGLSAWVGILNAIAAGTYHDADEDTEEYHEAGGANREKKGSNHVPHDDDDDDEEEWVQMNAETVECLIPLHVYPGNTAYRPVEVVFEV